MKARARFASILLLFLTGWQAAAAADDVAPERTGTGDGKSAANAAAWFDQQAYIHANISVRQEDTTIHFAPGTYIGRKRSGVSTRCMLLDNIGNSKHRLTLLGAPDRASVFIRDPEDPTDQVSSLRLDYFFDLYQCRNITLDDLHFTGPGALSYAIRIREPHDIALRNCTFINLTGVLYGVTCAMSGGSGVLWENCTFDNVGVSAYAHCIYNSTNVYDLAVRNCVFRDCYGEYVRFRDNCHRCTVENCLFEATGRYTGESFISCPLYNDEDPAVKTDPVYHEYFSQDLAIRNNTFIGRKRSQDFNQFVLNFLNDGYNPIGKHYLISKSEASALTTMPV